MLILNNPCNPSGIVYSQNEVEVFLSFAEKHQLFLLVDEVYSRITYSTDFCSVFACQNYSKYKDRILYVNSFSKTFAMTGWRVGYTILPKTIGKHITTILQNSITNVPEFCQEGARIAIKERINKKLVYEKFNNLYLSRHKRLIELFQKNGIDFIYPDGAFYFFINCHCSSDEFARNLLNEVKIAVVPGNSYGDDFKEFYRISFAVDQYSFDRFVHWVESGVG